MSRPLGTFAILLLAAGVSASSIGCRQNTVSTEVEQDLRNQNATSRSLGEETGSEISPAEPLVETIASSDSNSEGVAEVPDPSHADMMPTDASESYAALVEQVDDAMEASVSQLQEHALASSPEQTIEPSDQDVSDAALVATLNEPSRGSPARIYLPTTAGPLIIDVDVRIDDHPQQELFHSRIDAVLAEVAGESKKELGWTRLLQHVRSNPQQFGSVLQGVGNQTGELIRRMDKNRNQVVEHDELIKLLFRNARDTVAFRVRGTDYFRSVMGSLSKLLNAIDAGGDGHLDVSELEGVSHALLRLDQNSDQQIELDEAGDVSINDNDVWNPRRSDRYGDVAMDLAGYVDWNMMSYSLDSSPDRMPFGIAENPIAKLDEDGDGSISGEEAKSLARGAPHLSLLIQCSSIGMPTEVRVLSVDPTIERCIVDTSFRDQVTVADQSLQFTVKVTDAAGQTSRIPKQAFSQLDTNSDGFLDSSEIPPQASDSFSLEELDQDGDERLTFVEANRVTDSELPIWAWQIRGRAAEFPDRVFAWLDVDQNLVLSTREILDASRRLRECVQDDSPLRVTDIPDCYVLHLLRGDPAQDEQSFSLRPRPQVPSKEMPRWAHMMDLNRDNEISMQEFIGTREQFQELDGNGDGFIEAAEIKSKPL